MSKESDSGKKPEKKQVLGKEQASQEQQTQQCQQSQEQQPAAEEAAELPEEITLKREEFLQVKDRITALEKDRDDMKNLAQRVQADFDNFRRRNASLSTDCREEGAREVIRSLLPVLDNFDRALENAEHVDQGWVDGVKLVYRQLMETLEKSGLCLIPADGMFDPNFHEAVMQEEVEGAESGSILEVFQKGYQVKDRIVRHSMVKVAK